MTRALRDLSDGWQAAIALGGAVSFGSIVAFALAGWINLPAEVEAQGTAILELQWSQRSDSVRLAKIECYVKAIALRTDPAGCGP